MYRPKFELDTLRIKVRSDTAGAILLIARRNVGGGRIMFEEDAAENVRPGFVNIHV